MKKKQENIPWKDCITLLTWEKVRQYNDTQENFTLEMICHNGDKELFTGKMVFLRSLSENAFYFWFIGTHNNKEFAVKIKQNLRKPAQRYLQQLSVDAVKAYKAGTKMSD